MVATMSSVKGATEFGRRGEEGESIGSDVPILRLKRSERGKNRQKLVGELFPKLAS